MKLRRAIFECDVSHQREDFKLLAKNNLVVALLVGNEKAQCDLGKSADAGELAGGQTLLLCEFGEAFDDLITGAENDRESLWTIINEFCFHTGF